MSAIGIDYKDTCIWELKDIFPLDDPARYSEWNSREIKETFPCVILLRSPPATTEAGLWAGGWLALPARACVLPPGAQAALIMPVSFLIEGDHDNKGDPV